MSALPKIPTSTPAAPVYNTHLDDHLPDEGRAGRIVVGVLVGVPVATVVGGAIIAFSLLGTPAESHALVLSLPFGGMFGFLGGAIGGLMATMKAH